MLSGPYLAAAALLVVTAVPKLVDHSATAGALRSVGWPSSRLVVTAVALAELVVGLGALVVGGPLASLAVALVYLGFAAFLLVALSKGGKVASCGCIGKPDRPPTKTHLVLNLLAVVVAVSAATGEVVTVDSLLTTGNWPILLFAALTTWLAYSALSLLPVRS